MDGQNRPRSRVKKIVEGGKGLEKKGEGLGTGPVDHLAGEKAGQGKMRPPVQGPVSSAPHGGSQADKRATATPASGMPHFQQINPGRVNQGHGYRQGDRPAVQNSFASSRPTGTAPNSARTSSGSAQRGTNPFGVSGGGGCGGRLLLIVVVLAALLLGGGKLSGFFDGNSDTSGGTHTNLVTDQGGNQGSSGTGSILDSFLQTNASSGYTTGSGSSFDMLSGLLSGQGSSQSASTGSSNLGGGSLLDLFLNSASSSVYDSGTGISSYLSGSSPNLSSQASETVSLDEQVSGKARAKRTVIKGNGRDEVTILVYMCGTDLESQNGMGTADIKEMVSANLGDNVNLLVYTGGCRSWRNNVISNSTNQIYRIGNGKLYCLRDNMGNKSMTDPATLTEFIRYGVQEYPANRICLIFWDHGGGSVSGFGYDEKYRTSGSMTLAGINTALKNAGVTFDFIGFDACLMATVENAIMISQYADYMIASEETEPGVGWYYTNWLTQLGRNPSMPTLQLGKIIADDFVSECERKCRGQATTLSVVDLAELQATVPTELKAFSIDTSTLIQNKEYKTVSTARARTREFAQSTRIDQIDLVHFATNMNTQAGEKLAKAVKGAVKYNRTGGIISDAYGLSIYFPYKKAGKVSQMVSTYKQIGMDEEYTRCIQEFASLEVSGQVASGTPTAGYGSQSVAQPGLLSSLFGGSGYSSQQSSSGNIMELFGNLFGGDGAGDLASLFSGRSISAEYAAEYYTQNHFDESLLVWKDGRINLPEQQWALVESLTMNVYIDDGTGYIELGCDNLFNIEGTDLIGEFDGSWVSFNKQPVAYYYLESVELDGRTVDTGFIPVLLNGQRVNLLVYFDDGYGYVSGVQTVYDSSETETVAKNQVTLQRGDRLQFICNFYDYDGNFRNSYPLGDEIILGSSIEIANTRLGQVTARVNYCFTDIYQQNHWTPTLP